MTTWQLFLLFDEFYSTSCPWQALAVGRAFEDYLSALASPGRSGYRAYYERTDSRNIKLNQIQDCQREIQRMSGAQAQADYLKFPPPSRRQRAPALFPTDGACGLQHLGSCLHRLLLQAAAVILS